MTFGAATSDDVNWAMATTIGATGRSQCVTGWWRPTTLTATRGLWSAGNTIGAEIDSTTDELRLRTDNTTDGQWTTTGVDMVVDEWKFLAFLLSTNDTGPVGNWRVWAGTTQTSPVECTVSVATSPVGNHTGNATFFAGNKGTGTLAFQGDVAEVSACASGQGGTITSFFGIATTATITDVEALQIFNTYVLPHYRGEPWRALESRRHESTDYRYWAGNSIGDTVFVKSSTVQVTPGTATVAGATTSANGSPRPLRSCMTNPPQSSTR